MHVSRGGIPSLGRLRTANSPSRAFARACMSVIDLGYRTAPSVACNHAGSMGRELNWHQHRPPYPAEVLAVASQVGLLARNSRRLAAVDAGATPSPGPAAGVAPGRYNSLLTVAGPRRVSTGFPVMPDRAPANERLGGFVTALILMQTGSEVNATGRRHRTSSHSVTLRKWIGRLSSPPTRG